MNGKGLTIKVVKSKELMSDVENVESRSTKEEEEKKQFQTALATMAYQQLEGNMFNFIDQVTQSDSTKYVKPVVGIVKFGTNIATGNYLAVASEVGNFAIDILNKTIEQRKTQIRYDYINQRNKQVALKGSRYSI